MTILYQLRIIFHARAMMNPARDAFEVEPSPSGLIRRRAV
jgi:hypothetical protein